MTSGNSLFSQKQSLENQQSAPWTTERILAGSERPGEELGAVPGEAALALGENTRGYREAVT